MKGNKGVYILLPVVAVVWGLIAYRVVKYVGPGNTEIDPLPVTEVKFEHEKFEGDTFSILANYVDPFLRIEKQYQISLDDLTNRDTVRSASMKISYQKLPVLLYKGCIRNKKTGKVIAIITVNKTTKNLASEDTFEGLKIIQINSDSVKIRYGNKNYWLHKK